LKSDILKNGLFQINLKAEENNKIYLTENTMNTATYDTENWIISEMII